jgi:hypothetical protein
MSDLDFVCFHSFVQQKIQRSLNYVTEHFYYKREINMESTKILELTIKLEETGGTDQEIIVIINTNDGEGEMSRYYHCISNAQKTTTNALDLVHECSAATSFKVEGSPSTPYHFIWHIKCFSIKTE